MARADSNHTTPTAASSPVLNRRTAVSMLVGTALAGGAALNAQAITDPVYDAIRAHQEADAAMTAASNRISAAHAAADKAGLLATIKVPDCRNGSLRPYVAAKCDHDINEMIPNDEGLRQFYIAELDQRQKERIAFEVNMLGAEHDTIIEKVSCRVDGDEAVRRDGPRDHRWTPGQVGLHRNAGQ
jgi:hypothetical protein